VVDALGRGEQILILRKGGIHEGRGGFRVDYPRFLLFPTRFHQQRESVLEAAQQRYDLLSTSWPASDTVRIEFFAEVVAWRSLETLEDAEALRDQHIWRPEVIRERFDWGRSQNIFALAVRIFRLGSAVQLPMLPEYGGCKSWVDLANDLETVDPEPVLSDAQFESKLAQFSDALAKPKTRMDAAR
jgi:hypothetical protein